MPESLDSTDLFGVLPLDTLLLDTGSSNTWVGAGKKYVKTSSSMPTSDSVVCPMYLIIGNSSDFVRNSKYRMGQVTSVDKSISIPSISAVV